MSVRGRAIACVGALLTAACGGVRTHSPEHPLGGPRRIAGQVGGPDIALVWRPTAGQAWISVWIDAGSRDADPPALAAVAAWAATRGSGIDARVVPDGTELALACPTARLEACLGVLAGALATREPDAAALEAALEQLRARRRGARADEVRRADGLAIAALLGEAHGLDPLGEPDDDARIDAAAVASFWAAHWGPSRALLVVVGDVDEGRVRQAIAAHWAALPPALQVRAPRTIAAGVDARVGVGDRFAASVAIAVPGAERGIAIARRVLSEVEGATAQVFSIRGGDILLVRGADPRALAESVAYARTLRGPDGEAPVDDDHPAAVAARLGASWVARTEPQALQGGLGIGVVIVGGRGDGDSDDPDARSREGAERAYDALAREIAQPLSVAVQRVASAGALELRSDDGARALARREALDRVAVAIAVDAPAEMEPARLHGLRAMLARLLERCASGSAWIDARSFGLIVETSAQGASAAIDRVAGCVRGLDVSAAALEEARARAIAAAGEDDRRRALAALAIAPGAPAVIAPRGTPGSLAALDQQSLRIAASETLRRDRVVMAIVGEIDEEVAGREAIAALRRLPRAEPIASVPTVGIAADDVQRAPHDGPLEAIVAIRDPEPRGAGAEPGALALLEAMRAALDGPVLRVVWTACGAGREGAWVALAVRSDEGGVAELPGRVAAARARAVQAIDASIAREVERARVRRALSGASASELARRLVVERSLDAPDEEASRRAARALASAPVRWVLVRPTAGALPRVAGPAPRPQRPQHRQRRDSH